MFVLREGGNRKNRPTFVLERLDTYIDRPSTAARSIADAMAAVVHPDGLAAAGVRRWDKYAASGVQLRLLGDVLYSTRK